MPVDRETEGLVHEILGIDISGELTRRTLLTQTDEDFRERCLATYFSRDPTQQILALASQRSTPWAPQQLLGGCALLNPITMEVLDASSSRWHPQFATQLAYGFPAFGERCTITPAVGLVLSSD